MPTDAKIRLTREALIAQLQAKRAEIEAYEKIAMAEHRAAEEKWAKNARAVLKAAAKNIPSMTYSQLKGSSGRFTGHNGRQFSKAWLEVQLEPFPVCPVALLPNIDRELRMLNASNQQKYTIDAYSFTAQILTWTPKPEVYESC